jgi:hypothetical protein
MYKYLVEYLGVFVIVMANNLTEADPIIIGLTYFAVLTMSQTITNGYFNPFVPIVSYILGKAEQQDTIYNLLAQTAGGATAILFYNPVKIYVE